MSDMFAGVNGFPRADLLSGPTPIERLDRLSGQLGIDLSIKRDDLTGLGFGGNKVRQLEFYFGAALEKGADTVLITGAVQSNYARTAATAAAKLGLGAVVQMENRVHGMDETYNTSGNVLLSRMLGAEFMMYPEGEDEAGADLALRQRAEELRREGRAPYVIPLGLNNPPLGALGYMKAAEEILQQDDGFDCMVVASGSGLTHFGLLAGLRALGCKTPVHGICVRRDAAAQAQRLATVGANLDALLNCDPITGASDILTWDGALEPGYGHVGPPAREAIMMMARQEGLFLDPVYTGKSFAGVPGLLNEGVIKPGERVLFIHTGGQPALFAYQGELGM